MPDVKYDKTKAQKTLKLITNTQGQPGPVKFSAAKLTSKIEVIVLRKEISKLTKNVDWVSSWDSAKLKLKPNDLHFMQLAKGGLRLDGERLLVSGGADAAEVDKAVTAYFQKAYALPVPWTSVEVDDANPTSFDALPENDEDTEGQGSTTGSAEGAEPAAGNAAAPGEEAAAASPEPEDAAMEAPPFANKPRTAEAVARGLDAVAGHVLRVLPADGPEGENIGILLVEALRPLLEQRLRDLSDEEAVEAGNGFLANLMMCLSFTPQEHAFETGGHNALIGAAQPLGARRRINLDTVSDQTIPVEEVARSLYEEVLFGARLRPVRFRIEDCNEASAAAWLRNRWEDGLRGEALLHRVGKVKGELREILRSPNAYPAILGIRKPSLSTKEAADALAARLRADWAVTSAEFRAILQGFRQSAESTVNVAQRGGDWKGYDALMSLFAADRLPALLDAGNHGGAVAAVQACTGALSGGYGRVLARDVPRLGLSKQGIQGVATGLAANRAMLGNLQPVAAAA